MTKIVVGITGATGAILGVRALEALAHENIETHLVVSKWGRQTIQHETGRSYENVKSLAHTVYSATDMAAAISSGSFVTDGMMIVPCSMRTLAATVNGVGDTLIHRAADVILKERRRLVMVVREMPLNEVHLENMLKLSRMGVTILTPMPAFYNHPKSIDDIVNHIVTRVLDQFLISTDLTKRWDGEMKTCRFPLQNPE